MLNTQKILADAIGTTQSNMSKMKKKPQKQKILDALDIYLYALQKGVTKQELKIAIDNIAIRKIEHEQSVKR